MPEERIEELLEQRDFKQLKLELEDMYPVDRSYSGRLRFALYDTDMEYLFTDEELENIDYENAIVLADKNLINSDINGNRNQPLYKIEIDDYEYVFTSNKQIYDMVK